MNGKSIGLSLVLLLPVFCIPFTCQFGFSPALRSVYCKFCNPVAVVRFSISTILLLSSPDDFPDATTSLPRWLAKPQLHRHR